MEKHSTLVSRISEILNLISLFQTAAKAKEGETSTSDPSLDTKITAAATSNALELAHNAASQIRDHSINLSLLITHKPFTPSAIMSVLRELGLGPLPCLLSALESCDETRYTKLVKEELALVVDITYSTLSRLIERIPLDGRGLKQEDKKTLESVGLVMNACDKVMALKRMGIAGLIVKNTQLGQEILKDALEELKEWGEEESDEEEDDEESVWIDVPDDADTMFDDVRHIPRDDPDKIRDRLDFALQRLKTILIMHSAIIKRRFQVLPPLPRPVAPDDSAVLTGATVVEPRIAQTLDEVVAILQKIRNSVDELAGAFYELDAKEIDRRMDECFFLGWSAVELLVENWQGERDAFSEWAQKFGVMMKRGGD